MSALSLVFRAVFIYFFLILVMRVMGKREIANLSPFDFVLALIMAELAVIPLENTAIPLWQGLLPLAVLVFLELLFSFLTMRFSFLRRVLNGLPQVVIEKGRLRLDEMRRARYNLDELMSQLRQAGHPDLKNVDYAVLETSGELSVIPKQSSGQPGSFPWILISDGEIDYQNIRRAGFAPHSFINGLKEKGLHPKDIFLAMLNTDGSLWLQLKEVPGQESAAKTRK
ncbi:MAG: DUF421 domain-containing protein [Peptococcaceae bacterium]|nr:DUF421 domain-containing protein [Peptococcaceae bacterium]